MFYLLHINFDNTLFSIIIRIYIMIFKNNLKNKNKNN